MHSSSCAPVVHDGEDAEGEADTEGHGHSVLGVGGHALEDLPGANDSRANGGQPWLCEHDISRTSGSLSGTCKQQDFGQDHSRSLRSNTNVYVLRGGLLCRW